MLKRTHVLVAVLMAVLATASTGVRASPLVSQLRTAGIALDTVDPGRTATLADPQP